MNGFLRQSMAQNKLDLFPKAKIRQPVPGEHAFGAYHQVPAKQLDRLVEGFRLGQEIAMQDNLAGVIQNA